MDKKFLFIAGGGLLVVVILVIVLIAINGKKTTTVKPVKKNTFLIWDYNNEKTAYDPIIGAWSLSE